MNFKFFSTAAALTFLICSCSDSDEYYLLFKEGGKTGMIDYKGEIILENDFKGDLRPFQSGMALYRTKNTNYFIDKRGRESTDGYMQATDFGNGYAFVVNPGEKISAINTKFKVKKKLDYDEAAGFIGKVALVKKDGLYGAINSSLKEILPCKYEALEIVSNGEYIIVLEEQKYILFNSRGKKLLETKEHIYDPNEGMIPYYDDGFGYLDMSGKKVIRARREWSYASPFVNGYSTYLEDGRWGVLDKDGSKVIRAKYYYPIFFSDDGLAVTAKREERETGRRRTGYIYRYGFININDDEVVPFKYNMALNFHKGKAFVNDGKYWFIIDTDNKQYGRNEYTRIGVGLNDYNMQKSVESYFGKTYNTSNDFFIPFQRRTDKSIFSNTIRVRSDFFDINGAVQKFMDVVEVQKDSFLGIRPDEQPQSLSAEQGFSGMPTRNVGRNSTANRPLQLTKSLESFNDLSFSLAAHYAYPAYRSPSRFPNSVFTTPVNYITHYTLRMSLGGKGKDKYDLIRSKLDSALQKDFSILSSEDQTFRINEIFDAGTNAGMGFVELNVRLDFPNFFPKFTQALIPGDYPEFAIRKLTPEDLNDFDQEEQDIIRNEIFARNGFIFRTQRYREHFGGKDWYRRLVNSSNIFTTNSFEQVYAVLSPIEKFNVDMLTANRETDSVVDIDGNEYQIIEIGTQTWMAENLRTTKFSNGSNIQGVYDNNLWVDQRRAAFSYYNNEAKSAAQYGNLYNWYAAVDSRGLCPDGWRVPSDFDWMQLEIELGMNPSQLQSEGWRGNSEGSRLAGEANLWFNGTLVNNNHFGSSGFNALPGGFRDAEGNFRSAGMYGSFWSSTPHDDQHALQRWLGYKHSNIYRLNLDDKRNGYSVRCIKAN